MPHASEPASLAKADVVEWAVATCGYTGEKATFASAAAQDGYEWMAARAGMLNPDQVEEQQAACAAYVRQLAEARDGAVGKAVNAVGTEPSGEGDVGEAPETLPDGTHPVGFGFILGWIIASLIWNIISLLFKKYVADPKGNAQWKTMHAPGS